MNARQAATNHPPPSFFRSLILFLRVEYLVFAVMLPLYGAFTVHPSPGIGLLIGLIACVFLFHVYVSVLNDVMDLELDKTRHDRAEYPLVRGAIERSHALFIALMCIPAAYGFTYILDGGVWAYIALSTGIVFMGLYDIWGKKTRVPLLVDIAQGIGFASMTIYGADIAGDPNRMTAIAFIAVVLWMMNTNLYAGFRDLRTDMDYGLYTTPVMLDAVPQGNELHIPRRAMYYSLLVESALFGLAFTALQLNDFKYAPAVQSALLSTTGILALVTAMMTLAFYRVAKIDYDDMYHIARMIYACTGGVWLILFFPQLDAWLVTFIAGVFIWNYRSFSLVPFRRCWEMARGGLTEGR